MADKPQPGPRAARLAGPQPTRPQPTSAAGDMDEPKPEEPKPEEPKPDTEGESAFGDLAAEVARQSLDWHVRAMLAITGISGAKVAEILRDLADEYEGGG